MSRCHLTYQDLIEEGPYYSLTGLKKLNPRLKNLTDFQYSREEQRREIQRYSGKLSIQGIQPKLSARLSVRNETFEPVSLNGDYILKPQVDDYPELPQNEDLTMHLAKIAGITVPWHGLIRAKDGSLLYAVKRFDRPSRNKKIHQEDFAQLLGATRSTKYQASMEKVSDLIDQHCSFPTLELEKLFRLTIFSFLVGNEDMHLKNFSIQIDSKNIVKLTPAYDLVNTTIALVEAQEEMALELNEKKHGFIREDFVDYFGVEHCLLLKSQAEKIVTEILKCLPEFQNWVKKSFLSEEMQEKYLAVLAERSRRLR